ncbi:MAG: hypothetical protein H6718_04035 [Polyangiaceae bacterium]|nr:hypothetical protein [Polyangiaceae bacterium]
MSPSRKTIMGIGLPSDPPPDVQEPEHQYKLLKRISDQVEELLSKHSERIEKLEASDAKTEETLGRIEGKVDGLHQKDTEHDARLDKLAAAFEKKVLKVGSVGAVILAVVGTLTQTADQWGPVLLKLVEILVK